MCFIVVMLLHTMQEIVAMEFAIAVTCGFMTNYQVVINNEWNFLSIFELYSRIVFVKYTLHVCTVNTYLCVLIFNVQWLLK